MVVGVTTAAVAVRLEQRSREVLQHAVGHDFHGASLVVAEPSRSRVAPGTAGICSSPWWRSHQREPTTRAVRLRR